MSREVCHNFADVTNVGTSHSQQHLTHLHGTTSKFHVKPNSPTGLRYYKCPTAHSDGNTGRNLLEKADNTAAVNVSPHRNRLTGSNSVLRPIFNHRPKDRKKEDKSVSETISAVHYRKK